MKSNQPNFNRILVIDDNLAIHADFQKIFAQPDTDSELDDLDAELFGDESSNESNVDTRATCFELGFASQGKAGLDLLIQNSEAGTPFSMAFVDMRMPPGWDGVETIEHLWKHDSDLQVVICTAYSDRSWDEVFSRLGRTDGLLILKKPFDDIEVTQLATSLCEKRMLLAESRAREENLREVVETIDAELKVAHKDAEVLLDSIPSLLISMDENGLVSRWNPVAERLFGIPSIKAIGEKFGELPIEWTDWQAVATALHDCSIVQQKQLKIQFTDKRGKLKTLDTSFCPILNDATSKARLMIASDVTAQNSLQSQLDQAQRLESVGQLAAGVAHEINTPMQYIGDNIRFVAKSIDKLVPLLDCLHLLIDSDVTDKQIDEIRQSMPEHLKPSKVKFSLKQLPDALADSIEGVETVSKIVAAMKEFSHPGSEQKSKTCINHILESTITVAKNEWKYVADVKTEFEENLVKVDALSSELNQAFLNLIVNASHAIGDRVESGELTKGEIKITTQSTDTHVRVLIKDNGGGIPDADRERVFEPFFTTKSVGQGTGQGLAIALNVIVNKHGGRLSLDVEDNAGTTFIIDIPRDAINEPDTNSLETAVAERNI